MPTDEHLKWVLSLVAIENQNGPVMHNFLYADFAEVGASAKGRKKCLTLPFFIDIINAPYATGGKGASIGEAIYKKVSDY